jgi:hypothetical protein
MASSRTLIFSVPAPGNIAFTKSLCFRNSFSDANPAGTFSRRAESIPHSKSNISPSDERPSLRSTFFLCSMLFSTLPITLTAQPPVPAPTKPKPSATKQPEKNSQLPVTKVSLYKNGVGFFEHSAQVNGNQSVIIDFTSAQLNDVLQSLTAIDLNGGRISGAGYNSTTPLDQQLKALPLALGDSPTSIDFYNAIRGSRVEVHSPSGTLAGRLLSFEVRTTPGVPEDAPSTEKHFLTIAAESGDVRTFELTPTTNVRLLDTPLKTDLNRYLELIANNRSQGLRHLTLQDNGTGARDLRVSYISEVPIWKSTYRILLTDAPSTTTQSATLQGWSVVDNTTGSDWTNVQLSLIAGAPQSFIQPLSQPTYSRRPEIPIAQDTQLTPQTHESGDIRMLKEDGPPSTPAVAGMSGMGSGHGVLGGVMGGIGTAPTLGPGAGGNTGGGVRRIGDAALAGSVMGAIGSTPTIEYESAAADSLAKNLTTTTAFDDYFEYKISDPVTIRKNESALVPILQTKLPVERVTLWAPFQPTALRALWITNASNLTLDRGSFSIVEDGSFGGEGLLDPIHPNERRLLSYAADQAVRVTTDNSHNTQRVQRIIVAKGVLREQTASISEVEYIVHNAAPQARTVIVEQPNIKGWKLDSDPAPAETTPTAYRFRVATQPGESVRLHVGQRRTFDQVYRLVDTSNDQLTLILRNGNAGPNIQQQLEPIFSAKRAVADLDTQIKSKETAIDQITNDQKRLRDNLSALKGTTEERNLAKRYTEELNQQEDKLAILHKDLDTLHQQRDTAEQQLSSKIESLQLDEKI